MNPQLTMSSLAGEARHLAEEAGGKTAIPVLVNHHHLAHPAQGGVPLGHT